MGSERDPGLALLCVQLAGALGASIESWHQGLFTPEAAHDWLKQTIAQANQFAPGTFPEALRVDLEPVASADPNLFGLTAQSVRPDGTLDVVVRFRRTSDPAPRRDDPGGMFGIRG
jgi:hypothetical protein